MDVSPVPVSDCGLRSVDSSDVDQHAENLTAWHQRYEQLAPGRFAGTLDEIWLDGLQLFRERTNLAVFETGDAWPGARTFAVPLAMSGPATFLGRPVGPDSILVVDERDGLELRTPNLLDVACVSVPISTLESLGAFLEDDAHDKLLAQRRELPLPTPTMTGVRRGLADAFELLTANPAAARRPHARKAMRERLLDHLGSAVQLAAPEPRTTLTTAAYHRITRQARDLVLSRPTEPMTVGDLCAALKVSRRTLQSCFQTVLGTSPHQYLRTVRLNGLHRALRQGRPGDAVQVLAADWGFWHLSNCAADYRRLFGELPSVTLRRAQGLNPADC